MKLDQICRESLLNSFSSMAVFSKMDEELKQLAKDLDKEVPRLKVSGSDIYIGPKYRETLRVCFTHLLRNVMDHGIESKEVRLEDQ